MWEEDPRFQNAIYRFLIGSVVTLTVIAVTVSVLERDWELLGHLFLALGALCAALCLYAVVVWLAFHIVRLVAKLVRRIFHKDRHDT
jgi:hypothetical protein